MLGDPAPVAALPVPPRPQRQPRHADGPRRAARRHDRRGGSRRADRARAADQGRPSASASGSTSSTWRRSSARSARCGGSSTTARRADRGYLPATGRRGLQWSQRFRRRAAVITPDPPDTAHLAPAPHLHAVACRQSRTGSPAPRRVPQSGRTTLAQRQRQRGSRRTPAHARHKDNEGIVPVLARAVRELESAVQRGPLAPGQRVRFQVVALLVREQRAPTSRASTELTDAQKAERAQAPRRHRDDPRQDRDPRPLPLRPALRGVRRHRLRPRPAPGDAAQGGRRGRARGAEARRRGRPGPSASAASSRSPCVAAPAGQPVPRPRLRHRPRAPQRPRPALQLGAARPAVPLLRARRRRSSCMDAARAHLARRPRQARADAAPGRR